MINIDRINLLRLSNIFLYDLASSPIRILPELIRLETLMIHNIESKYLEKLLHQLISLPLLSSLVIVSVDDIENRTPIYRLILGLPALKYCSLTLKGFFFKDEPLSLNTGCYSPIEQLIINNKIEWDNAYALMSYVLRNRRLSLQLEQTSNTRRSVIQPPLLNHFTHVFLELSCIKFDRFQQMAMKLFSKIEVLQISRTCNERDVEYIDPQRWEQLIVCHIPKLRIFDIRHESSSINQDTLAKNSNSRLVLNRQIKKFSTSFWIERQWFFAIQCVRSRDISRKIFYSTYPYRYVRR